jgi:hypothetical protein
MRMILRTLATAAAVIALSGAAFAAQATPAAKPTAVKPAKAAKVTAMATSGTISKFDAASNTLTVTTAKGDVMFMVGSTSTVTADGKKIAASDLPSHAGHKVSVRYTESGGQKMASSVRVSMAAPKAASTKKTSTAKKPV